MPPSPDDVEHAAATLRGGGLVVFPTETVYGVGADAGNAAAVRRIFEVKARPPGQPLTVHVGTSVDPDEWALDIPFGARRLMEAHWPGPLTVVLRSRPGVLDVVRGGGPTVGLRMPDDPVTLDLFDRFGGGVAGTSANRHGQPSPTTAAEAVEALGDDPDVVLDGGPCRVGVASTVVDFSGPDPVVLRLGALPLAEIERLAGRGVRLADQAS